jgi:hypothetical protein
VGLDLAVTSKAPFGKCPHPAGLYPKTYPNLLSLLYQISHCCKSLDFDFFANSMKSGNFSRFLKIVQVGTQNI